MLESAMRQIVVRSLRSLDALSVENLVGAGTPDVNYIGGWIELKVLKQWPKRVGTCIKVPCFTPQQRVWLQKRWMRGGDVFFLILINTDWLLFDGRTAGESIGRLNKEQMIDRSLMFSEGRFDQRALFKVLKSGTNRTK